MGQLKNLGDFNELLRDYAAEIEHKITTLGIAFTMDIYVGEFPTGSFNAQACPAPGGALLLVNTGLMMFIHQTVKIMMHAVFFRNDPSDESPENTKGNIIYTRPEIIKALADVVIAYLTRGDSRAARRFPAEGGGRGMLAAALVGRIERFVLAHEYGHAIAGHLDASEAKTITADSAEGVIEVIAKSWEQEFVADIWGVQLILPSENVIDTMEKLAQLQLAVAGPLLFFALDSLINVSYSRSDRLSRSQVDRSPPF